jgi:hypothetical protein
MGERISWAEGAQQLIQLQTLMMEAYATQLPEFGVLVRTDEPELLIDYLNRAKQKDPALQDMIISIKSMGVIIYHDVSKQDVVKATEGVATNDQKD